MAVAIALRDDFPGPFSGSSGRQQRIRRRRADCWRWQKSMMVALERGADRRGGGRRPVLPYADTTAMNAHPAEIARTVAPGAHAMLVLDGAGWQGCKDFVVLDRISLRSLPPLCA